MLIHYDKLRIGDKLWSIQLGDCTVTDLKRRYITVEGGGRKVIYTGLGMYAFNDKYPSLLTKNPIFPRLVEVSNDEKEWIKAWLVTDLSETTYWAYPFIVSEDSPLDSFKRSRSTRSYRCCREIEERKLELTLEEIADKFGISVENLKIKK